MRSSVTVVVSLLLISQSGWAQDTEDPLPAGAPPALAAPQASESTPSTNDSSANHSLSSETSARVVAGLPRYSPPKTTANESEDPPDLREIDKPKNGIIRLPRYQVRERRLPVLKDRELLTPEGKLDLAFKRRPGLKVGNLFGLNRGIAMAMLAEDEAYERRMEMAELSSFTAWMDANFPVDPKTGQRTELAQK